MDRARWAGCHWPHATPLQPQRSAKVADRSQSADWTTHVTKGAHNGTLSGITRADNIEQAFEASARLAAIVDSSQDAIIGKTLEGVITSWNAGAERLYGYQRDEIVGRNICELIPHDRVRELELVIARVARGEAVQPFETQRLTKDGSTLDMSVVISAIRDSSGTVTGAATVARDLTEIRRSAVTRHSLEAQLRRANSRLTNLEPLLRKMPPRHRGPGADLTPRELDVLNLMAQGLINKQVARLLGLRLNTVRNHSQHILYKLRAHSRLEAVATAVRDGLIGYPFETAVD
jgi:PAS domain S-box-containing protein